MTFKLDIKVAAFEQCPCGAEGLALDNNQTWNDILPGLAFSPGVHKIRPALGTRAGPLVLDWLLESKYPAIEIEYPEHQGPPTSLVVDATGKAEGLCQNPDDAEIFVAAVNRLDWNLGVPMFSVKVAVKSGEVTLTGEVDRPEQRQTAERDVAGLAGVTGVSNQIHVRDEGSESLLLDKIQRFEKFSWVFNRQIAQFRI